MSTLGGCPCGILGAGMPSTERSKRKGRKPRAPQTGAPRAVASTRREERAARIEDERRTDALSRRRLGTAGERPAGPFGGLPVSEIAIFFGLVSLVVGIAAGKPLALIIGALLCAAGVLEFTIREHFSGYRSHTILLAGVPAVLVEVLLAMLVGVPSFRILILLPIIPVFGVCFWLLRRQFQTARHARVTRPPSP